MAAKFYVGASTAGHQVDGSEHDQWTAWEKLNAERLATTAEKRLSWLPNWSDIKTQATDPANYLSGTGIEHKQHFREDFDLLKKLGLNSFRFSIEWAELEPTEGQWDQTAIGHYHRYFDELKKRGIEPFVTLWHWTMPQWFEAKGGLTKRRNQHYFERFAAKVIEEFGGELQYLLVLNEPSGYTAMSFLLGEWPPQKRSLWQAWRVLHNLRRLQRSVYKQTKDHAPSIQISSAHNLNNIQPQRPDNWFDRWGTLVARYIWNWWFINKTKDAHDFIGVNYYFTDHIKNFRRQNPKQPLNDRGWFMEPTGLEKVLTQTWARYHKPIIITETGLADARDQHRAWWIEETLAAVKRAQEQGTDVFGYLHWSLLDNFEWAEGWWPKFGLIAVDRTKPDMPRTIRPSAKKLSKL